MSDAARPRPSARRGARVPAEGAPARSTALADPEPESGIRPDTADGDEPDTTAPDTTAPDATEPEAEVEDEAMGGDGAGPRGRGRLTVPLVPVLGVLLVLLLGLNAYLLAPRLFAEESSVRTDTYVDVLQAARANVVDLTSFDHLTIDDDIQQARRVTTGDLRDETVTRLEEARQTLVDSQAVASTEVVGAGVTRATEDEATVVMVIATTRQAAGAQAEVSRSRIEVELRREGDRWLLSGITGR